MSLNSGKEISKLSIMDVRLKGRSAKLNRKALDAISRKYFDDNKRLSKIIKKGDAEYIRRLTDKRAKEIAKATSLAKKNAIIKQRKKEIATLQKNAAAAKSKLKGERAKINNLLSKGIGVLYTKAGNLVFKDLTTADGRNSMKKQMTIMTDANVSTEGLNKRIKQYEKAEKVWINKLKEKRFRKKPPYRTIRKPIAKGVKVDYLYNYYQMDGEFNVYDEVAANIKRVLNNTKWRHPNAKFNIRLSTASGDDVMKKVKSSDGKIRMYDSKAFSLPTFDKWDIDSILEIFDDKFELVYERYDEEELETEGTFDFETIAISYLVEPSMTMGAGGHKTLSQANKVWFISDTASKTNCFYRSISFIRILRDFNSNEDTEYIRSVLLEEPECKVLKQLINGRAKQMKSRLTSKTRKTTTEEDIQRWVDFVSSNARTRCRVKIYNNVFGLEKTIEPKKITGKLRDYEIWCINHHFIPMVRWYELSNIKPLCEEKQKRDLALEMEKEDADDNTTIDKKIAREIENYDDFLKWVEITEGLTLNPNTEDPDEKKKIAMYEGRYKYHYQQTDKVRNTIVCKNNRIATYDIEATGNGNNQLFKCYRISMAWNDLQNNGSVNKNNTLGLGYKFKSFDGENCIAKFFDFLYKNRAEFSAFTFYAHNAGKFDLLLLLNEYIYENTTKWLIDEESVIVLNGAYLNMELISKGMLEGEGEGGFNTDPPTIRFRDSLRLLPMSLEKLGIDFNVPHKKNGKDLEVNFDEINLENCYGKAKHSPAELFKSKDFFIDLTQRVYCDYDTICLLECLNIFNNDIYDAMNIDMTGCLTGASLSKQNFFKNYYNKKHIPIYHMNKEFDAFCREGYMGGRCEAHFIGEHSDKCYYYDFTSLYPDVGRRRLPYGRPKKVEGRRVDRWNKHYKQNKGLPLIIGMMKFRIRTKDFDALPIHGIKINSKLIFPHFENWTELTLWSNEFNYANSLNIYEYELIEAVHFGDREMMRKDDKESFWEEGILKSFFEDAVEKKALAKKDKKPALAQSYKIVANSGYGFWGLNANGDDGFGRDGVEIIPKDDLSFWEMLKKGEVNNVGSVGEYTIVRTTKPMPCKDFNVSIASAISSEARIKIHKFMNAIKRVGGKLLYCDTDSCICDTKLCDYPELMEEFCWDGTGEALGSMKNEAEEKLEKYFKKIIEKDRYKTNRKYKGEPKAELKKLMKKQLDLDGGEYHFDKGIIAGCKQYCLHKTTFDGGEVIAEASKGCKRSLDYSDFHHLLYGSKMEEQKKYEDVIREKKGDDWVAPAGFRLYEKQTQFRSGLIEHIKEGDCCDVRIVQLDKSMRVNYLKGKVEDVVGSDGVRQKGVVKPLLI